MREKTTDKFYLPWKNDENNLQLRYSLTNSKKINISFTIINWNKKRQTNIPFTLEENV